LVWINLTDIVTASDFSCLFSDLCTAKYLPLTEGSMLISMVHTAQGF